MIYLSLKVIFSTGSPLRGENFDYVYQEVKDNIRLSSISGGTDIISCFALGNPQLPVYRDEIQCIGLGMDVQSLNSKNKSVKNMEGELICAKPFPSMPISFWKDKDDKKYFESYFNKFPNVWYHGDFISIYDHGGVQIFGRSDTTLNPGGVRIGTSEIYDAIDTAKKLSNINIKGLMSMAPFDTDTATIKKTFKKTRKIYDKLKNDELQFEHLSMGMSNDFEIAIEEGANMIRVGSKIFS